MASQPTASAGDLLGLIRQAGGATRQELLQRTGMARSTLYGRLDQLQSAGLIHQAQQRSSTGGRPAAVLAMDVRDRVVLTIDIGHHRATVSLCDLEGGVHSEVVVQRQTDESLPNLVDRLCDLGSLELDALPHLRLLGVGLAIPAPVNTHTGVRLATIALPDADYPIAQRVGDRFGCRVSVENDARALALGAATEVPPMDDDGVLLGVKYSTGLGLGLLTGGRIMRGSTGAAGDLGHLQITPGSGPRCTCGRRGCLAAYVSGRSLVDTLARPGVDTVGDLVALYDAGDAQVVERVHDAARVFGTHLGGFVQVHNPQYVIFGGFLGGRESIAAKVVESIAGQVSARISDVAEYRVVSGDRTTSSGLVALVVDDVLAPEVVDRALVQTSQQASPSN